MLVTRAHAYEIRSADLAEHFFGADAGERAICLDDGTVFRGSK